MKRTPLFIDEATEHDLHALARREGIPMPALVRESLGRYRAEETGRKESADPFSFQSEILRCAQNDMNSLLRLHSCRDGDGSV